VGCVAPGEEEEVRKKISKLIEYVSKKKESKLIT
jgi:hypothetical protein